MSLRDLVTFAQNEISRGELLERRDHSPRPSPIQEEPLSRGDDFAGRVPAQEDYDVPTIVAEPALMPDWIRDPENEIFPIRGPASAIFTEGDFDEPISRRGGAVPKHGADVLAYYLPFHFYRNGLWGVYIRAKGILDLAAELRGGPITHGRDSAVHAATVSLFEHELFHCSTEAAATRAEVVARWTVYRGYFDDRHAKGHEEAMANAFAHHKIGKAYPSFIKQLESWMSGQGPGYRDFHIYLGKSLGRGKLVCSQHILRFVPPKGHLPSTLPSDFLFGRATSVPTYIVLDAEIASGVLRPFPKYKGVVVDVHTREHPPPHIHVEIPPGREITRCEWPSLEPLSGDPPLSNKQRTRLREYLRKYGTDVCEKLRSVYGSTDLAMPVF